MKSKKVLALLLAFVLTFALCGGAFADGEEVGATAPTQAPAQAIKDMEGQIVILYSNDVHGALSGYAKIAAMRDAYKARGADTLLIDAGDYFQGTTYVSLSKGANAVDMMNLAKYDIITVGNHEFDYGYENMKSLLKDKETSFKVVCANVKYNNKLVFDANTIVTTDKGVKLGFFGLDTPETMTKANPALVKGVEFTDIVKAAEEQVAALKAEKCDYIICIGHLGVSDESAGHRSIDLIKSVKGIDIFIDGHSHTVIDGDENDYETGDTMLTSTGTKFENIGEIIIKDGKLESNLVKVTDDMAADETVKAAADKIIADIEAEYGVKFASTECDLNGERAFVRTQETNLGDLIADSLLWKAEEQGVDVDAAITNGGGIRASIKTGDITKNDINTVEPFGNTLSIVEVTGKDLLELLEASTFSAPDTAGAFPQVAGIEFEIDETKDYNPRSESYPNSTYYGPETINRVTVNTVDGKAFDPNATYRIVTNNFLAAGGDTYYTFASSKINYNLGIPMDEALIEYIADKLGGVVKKDSLYAEPEGRIVIREDVCDVFKDVKDTDWFVSAVQYCYENGYIKGYGDGIYAPADSLTFGHFLTILYRLTKGFEIVKGDPATTGENWQEAAAALAAAVNVKVEDMNAKMNRADVAMISKAVIEAVEKELDETVAKLPDIAAFKDCVGHEQAEAIEYLHQIGLVEGDGDGNYRPNDGVKRSEAAKIIFFMETKLEGEAA